MSCCIKNAGELIQFLSVNEFSFHGDFEKTRPGHSSDELCLKIFKSAIWKDPNRRKLCIQFAKEYMYETHY